jgi:hypothetical protein
MTETKEKQPEFDAKEQWVIVVVYEDGGSRDHAVEFFDELTSQIGPQAEFDVSWWAFAMLRNGGANHDAARKAAVADMIVFALRPGGDLPHEIKSWIEASMVQRGEREGAVVGLMEGEPAPCAAACLKEVYLRRVAHRSGMDYLSHAAPTAARAIPDSLDSYQERAGQITSVLDEILHTQPPPSPPPR